MVQDLGGSNWESSSVEPASPESLYFKPVGFQKEKFLSYNNVQTITEK